MDTLAFILDRFQLDGAGRPPFYLKISRWKELPELFRDLGYKTGLEMGVETGVYSERLCQLIPGLDLYSVDAWQAYAGYRDHVSQAELDGFYKKTKARLAPFGAHVIRGFSLDVVKEFPDGYFDFVYIDGNHNFLSVTQDIAAWAPKVRKGGILAGHDFRRSQRDITECNVKDVVQAWAYAHKIRPWFVITRDKCPSWMWVC